MLVVQSNRLHVVPAVRLRWYMQYQDGSEKYGSWDNGAPDLVWQPSQASKKGLRFVGVQAKQLGTNKVAMVCEASPEEFICFRWLAVADVPLGGIAQGIKVAGAVHGIQLQTENIKYNCYRDGKINILRN